MFKHSLLLLLILVSAVTGAANLNCIEQLKTKEAQTHSVPANKRAYFNMVADAISKHREEFRELLLRFDNIPGTDLELELVDRILKDELDIELFNLERTPTLNNVVVYGATNVPFYTLIAHGVVPKSISKNVWFRTPELTRELYLELFNLLKDIYLRVRSMDSTW